MKKLSTLIFIVIFSLISFSINAQNLQEPVKRNTVFVELAGNSGSIYSINYDRILVSKEKWKIAGRVGGSYLNSFDKFKKLEISMPLEISILRGKGPHYLEFGMGATPKIFKYEMPGWRVNEIETIRNISVLLLPRIGYRYQQLNGGQFFKIGFTPFYGIHHLKTSEGSNYKYTNSSPFWGGIAIGHTFR